MSIAEMRLPHDASFKRFVQNTEFVRHLLQAEPLPGLDEAEIVGIEQARTNIVRSDLSQSVQSNIISAVGPCFFSNCSDAQTHGNPNNQRIRSPWIGRLGIRQGRVPTGTRLALWAPAGYVRGGPRVRPAGPWSAQPCKFDMPQT